MTTQDKLPPLAERLLDQRHYCDSFAEKVAYRHSADLAAPYDALIRQQEARIAELDLRVAVLQESLRERDETIEGLEKENERLRVIVHHAAEAARERRYQIRIEQHDAPTNMMRSRNAEAKAIGMAMALAIRYEEPEE